MRRHFPSPSPSLPVSQAGAKFPKTIRPLLLVDGQKSCLSFFLDCRSVRIFLTSSASADSNHNVRFMIVDLGGERLRSSRAPFQTLFSFPFRGTQKAIFFFLLVTNPTTRARGPSPPPSATRRFEKFRPFGEIFQSLFFFGVANVGSPTILPPLLPLDKAWARLEKRVPSAPRPAVTVPCFGTPFLPPSSFDD